MTTDHDVSAFAPNFRQRLWQELAQVHDQRNRTDRMSDPEQLDAASPAGTPGRRPGRRSIVVGAVSIAATALLVAGLGGDGDGRGRDGASIGTSLVAEVLTKTEAATANSVVHTVWNTSSDDARSYAGEAWMDQTTGSVHYTQVIDGVLQMETGKPVTPPSPGGETETARVIYHCDQTYADEAAPRLGDPPGGDAFVNEALANGWLVDDGTEVVDGRELLRLRYAADNSVLTGTDDYLLVDPATHLPVRYVSNEPDGLSVVTFEYLPRTPENLALASAPPIPEGYTEIDLSDPVAGACAVLGVLGH